MSDPLNPEQLRSLTPLNVLSEQLWRELRSQLVPQHLLAGQLLFREGDQARLTYYLLSGELLLVSASGQQEHLVAGSEASCHPLSPSLPRLHEVRALTDVSLLVLDSATLARLLTWRSAYHDLLLELEQGGEDVEWVARLLENPLFAKVPPSNVRAMLGRLQRVELPAGSAVLREGDIGDCCYFLKSGRAEVIRGAGSAHQVLAELEVGACFGEEALLADQPRNASVTLLEDGVVLRLDRQDFFALLKAGGGRGVVRRGDPTAQRGCAMAGCAPVARVRAGARAGSVEHATALVAPEDPFAGSRQNLPVLLRQR